jgi:hypothetical protein
MGGGHLQHVEMCWVAGGWVPPTCHFTLPYRLTSEEQGRMSRPLDLSASNVHAMVAVTTGPTVMRLLARSVSVKIRARWQGRRVDL